MPVTPWATARKKILAMVAQNGSVMLGELKGIEKRVAEHLVDRGELSGHFKRNGDYMIYQSDGDMRG